MQRQVAVVLKVHEVSKSYASAEGRVSVLAGVSLALAAGESLALTGESGSGKSTLLHLIAGLDTPDAGCVEVGGTRLDALDDAGRAALRRGRIGLVFQQFNLIPSLTAGANLAFQARLAGRHDEGWCMHLAGTMGLSALFTVIRRSFQAASSSASPSAGRWRATSADPCGRADGKSGRGDGRCGAGADAGVGGRDGGGAFDGHPL
jgi:ABC-type sugar transport system ATPase subunit